MLRRSGAVVIPRGAEATRGISGWGATFDPEIPQVAKAPIGMTRLGGFLDTLSAAKGRWRASA